MASAAARAGRRAPRLLLKNAAQIVVVGGPPTGKKGAQQGQVDVLENHSMLVDHQGVISAIVPAEATERLVQMHGPAQRVVDCTGRCVLPGADSCAPARPGPPECSCPPAPHPSSPPHARTHTLARSLTHSHDTRAHSLARRLRGPAHARRFRGGQEPRDGVETGTWLQALVALSVPVSSLPCTRFIVASTLASTSAASASFPRTPGRVAEVALRT